jgi:DNA-binding CsgD family transcriptional regulator
METTPLVGRSGAVEQVIASVAGADRSGCLIVGDTGTGKTALAQTVVDVLKAEHPVFGISGTPALSKMAFAVLAPFLAGMETGPEPSQELVFQAICRFFRLQRTESSQIPIMVVDDAHDVDPGSRTILARMVAGDTVRLIVLSARSSMPVEFMELWADGFLGRCDLDSLTPSDVHVLCENVLQGQVLRSVSAMLTDVSKGNPLALAALLRQGRADRSLFERNGVWLAADIPFTDMQFAARLGKELMRLPRDEYELLETIALAEPLPLEVLTSGGVEHALHALKSLELITISDDVPRFVRLANPTFSDALRQAVPAVRSSELRHKHGDLTEDMLPEQLVRHVSWALDCGAPLPPHVLVRAARAGNGRFDFRFTLRAAAAMEGSAHLDEMWLETAIAHAHLGHQFAARDQLERVLHESNNLPVLLRAVLWICLMPTTGSDPGQHRRLNLLLADTAERVAGLCAGKTVDNHADTIRHLIQLHKHVAEGKSAAVEEALNALAWHTPGIDVRTQVVCLTMLGNLLNAAGRFTEGRAATSGALELAQENIPHLPMEFEYAFLHHIKGLLLGGQWHEAAVRLADYRRDRSRNLIYSGAVLQLFEGSLAVWQGKVKSGVQQLQPAIEGLRQGTYTEFVPFGSGVMAYAAALCGDAELVDECVEYFPPEITCSDKGLYLLGKAYALAAMAVTRRTDDAAQQLSDLAAQAKSSGLLAAKRAALTLAVRVGHAGSAGRLARLASTLEGPISEVLQLFSHAVMGNDSDALLDAAATARREGFHLIAVNCVEQAVMILDGDADRTRRNAAQAVLRQYRMLLDGPFVLGGYESSRTNRLTPREREIVELALSGQSNREIARRLSLSARTVEGHFYRVFAKFGVSSRAELLASGPLPGLERA